MAAPEGQYRLPLQTGTLILPGAGSTEHCNLVRTALDNITSANCLSTQHSGHFLHVETCSARFEHNEINNNFEEVGK